jgi:hypothetical protein
MPTLESQKETKEKFQKAQPTRESAKPKTSADLGWRFQEKGMEFLNPRDVELAADIFKDTEGLTKEEAQKIIEQKVFNNLFKRYPSLAYLTSQDIEEVLRMKRLEMEFILEGESPSDITWYQESIESFLQKARDIALEAVQLEIASGIANKASSEEIQKNTEPYLRAILDTEYVEKQKKAKNLTGTPEEIRKTVIEKYITQREKFIRDQDARVHPVQTATTVEKPLEKTQVLSAEKLPGYKTVPDIALQPGLLEESDPGITPTLREYPVSQTKVIGVSETFKDQPPVTRYLSPLVERKYADLAEKENLPALQDTTQAFYLTLKSNEVRIQDLYNFYKNPQKVKEYLNAGARPKEVDRVKLRLENYIKGSARLKMTFEHFYTQENLYFETKLRLEEAENLQRQGSLGESMLKVITDTRKDLEKYKQIMLSDQKELEESFKLLTQNVIANSVDIFLTEERMEAYLKLPSFVKIFLKGYDFAKSEFEALQNKIKNILESDNWLYHDDVSRGKKLPDPEKASFLKRFLRL